MSKGFFITWKNEGISSFEKISLQKLQKFTILLILGIYIFFTTMTIQIQCALKLKKLLRIRPKLRILILYAGYYYFKFVRIQCTPEHSGVPKNWGRGGRNNRGDFFHILLIGELESQKGVGKIIYIYRQTQIDRQIDRYRYRLVIVTVYITHMHTYCTLKVYVILKICFSSIQNFLINITFYKNFA